MLEFEILVHGSFLASQCEIDYEPARTMPLSQPIQAWMNIFWEKKLVEARQRQTLLYDAPLFRLVSAQQEGERLHLVLGNTSYKEYVTTREPAFADQHERHELGNALSVCSVVETSDGFILVL